MTSATAAASGPVCQSCGGPCWQWKGSVWGYTCTACIDRYLDDGAARWAAKSDKAKERVNRNLLHDNDYQSPVTADRRRDGVGQRYVPHLRPGVDHPGDAEVITI